MNINKTIIIGRITKDLELKKTPNGNGILDFSVATNYNYKNKDGEKIEETEFHNIVSFGKTAENIAKFFVKGQEIYVEGRLKTNNWEDKETGKKMYKTSIICEKFEFGAKPTGAETQTKKDDGVVYPTDDIDPEDIPF